MLGLFRRALIDEYCCAECSSTFTSQVNVEAHITTLHSLIGTHICDYCRMTFKDNWHLKRHMYTHGVVDQESPHVKNACSLCNSTFPDGWHLAKHLKSHETGESLVPHHRMRRRGRGSPIGRSIFSQKEPGSDWGGDGSRSRPLHNYEQFLENYQRTADLKHDAMEFYCGICGEGLPRSKFSTHALGHLHDVFEVRKGNITEIEGSTNTCTQCQDLSRKVKVLDEIFEGAGIEDQKEAQEAVLMQNCRKKTKHYCRKLIERQLKIWQRLIETLCSAIRLNLIDFLQRYQRISGIVRPIGFQSLRVLYHQSRS